MEVYNVILIDLSTKVELTVQVEVDEGETSENIAICAKISEQEFSNERSCTYLGLC